MNPIYKALLLGGVIALAGCNNSDDDEDEIIVPPPVAENIAPEAADDVVTVQGGETTSIDVLANDGDEDGDELTVTAVGDADNGTVAIGDDGASVDYTPADSFLGEDSFTYTISDGEDTAEATVTVTVQQTVTVNGRVIDAPISVATVTVTVGENTFTTTADNDGYYSIDISYTDGTELLVLNAQGSPINEQEYVTLVSIMPSLATLQTVAGEDGILERSEASGTHVTNVTTASAVLAAAALGGNAPTNEEELETAQAAIQPETLLELAAVIKLIIDYQDFSLPAGSADILSFANNIEAYNAFVAEVQADDPELLSDIVENIINDPEVVAIDDSAPPSYYINIFPTRQGFISTGSRGFLFNSGGTGEVFTSFFTEEGNNTTMSWEKDDRGFYNITFDAPVVSTNFPSIYDVTDDPDILAAYEALNITQVEGSRYQFGTSFKVISAGTRNDTVQIAEIYTEAYPPLEYEGTTYEIPTRLIEIDYQGVFINGDKVEYWDADAEDVVGVWAVSMLGRASPDDVNRFFYTELVTFAANGTFTSEFSGQSGEWTIDDESIVVMTYGDVTQQVEVIAQEGKLYGGLVVAETDSGSIVAGYDWVVKQNPDFSFTVADMLTAADENWFAYVNAWQTSGWVDAVDEPTIGNYFGWQFVDEFYGFNVSLYCDEFFSLGYCAYGETTQGLNWNGHDWSIATDTGAIEMDRAYNCSLSGLPTNCRTRSWYPLDVEENGFVYILEIEDGNNDPDGVGERFTNVDPRVNIFEKRTLPEDLSNPGYPGADVAGFSVFGFGVTDQAAPVQRTGFLPRLNQAPTGM